MEACRLPHRADTGWARGVHSDHSSQRRSERVPHQSRRGLQLAGSGCFTSTTREPVTPVMTVRDSGGPEFRWMGSGRPNWCAGWTRWNDRRPGLCLWGRSARRPSLPIRTPRLGRRAGRRRRLSRRWIRPAQENAVRRGTGSKPVRMRNRKKWLVPGIVLACSAVLLGLFAPSA